MKCSSDTARRSLSFSRVFFLLSLESQKRLLLLGLPPWKDGCVSERAESVYIVKTLKWILRYHKVTVPRVRCFSMEMCNSEWEDVSHQTKQNIYWMKSWLTDEREAKENNERERQRFFYLKQLWFQSEKQTYYPFCYQDNHNVGFDKTTQYFLKLQIGAGVLLSI